MWLYTVCIEDLLIKINKNKKINGYKLNILDNCPIINKAYADDVTCFTKDFFSIKEILNEFEVWGNYSGSKINKEKTKILSINNNIVSDEFRKYITDEVKILGLYFDKFGPSKTNIVDASEKMCKSLTVWNNCNMDMIQRITALKTFIMSKMWFVLKFFKLNEKQIKLIEKDMYNFVWKGKREFIEREQMIKIKEEGGLNMICLRSTLNAMNIKYFYDFVLFHDRHEYQFNLLFFKNFIKDHLKNFNIIPVESEKNMPFFYKSIFFSIKDYLKIDKKFLAFENQPPRQKEIYLNIKKSVASLNKIELNSKKSYNWKLIYKSIHLKQLSSKLRSNNYKILNNGLPTADKFVGEKNNKCHFCVKEKENLEHVYGKCEIVMDCIRRSHPQLLTEIKEANYETFSKNINLNKKQIIIFSNIKLIIWQTRSIIKYEEKKSDVRKLLIKKLSEFSDNDHG